MGGTALMAETMGKRIKRLRKQLKLKQQQLADDAGISIFTLRQIEQGKHDNPTLTALRGLARVLGVTLDELAGEE